MKVVGKKDNKVEKLKVPPHSLDAEQSVIGSLLISPAAWDSVAEVVVETDFYNHSHKLIYKAF